MKLFTGEKIALPAGQKKYKFSLKLTPTGAAADLPGSFRDPNGFILYQVVVYLQQELRSYKQAEKIITVQSYYNLSIDKGLMNPVIQQKIGKSPSLGMLHFLGLGRKESNASTAFRVSFRSNRSGYLVGKIRKIKGTIQKNLRFKLQLIPYIRGRDTIRAGIS